MLDMVLVWSFRKISENMPPGSRVSVGRTDKKHKQNIYFGKQE
jgi:hypothetical protein